MDSKDNLIYCLVDPFSLEIRYVGLSTRGLVRPQTHFYPSSVKNPTNHRTCWVRSVIRKGKKPIIRVIQSWQTITREELARAEVYWISHLTALGCSLTNSTAGGEGSVGYIHTQEDKIKMSLAKAGVTLTAEHREKISTTLRGNKRALGHTHDRATRKKMSERVFTETARENMGRAQRGKKHSPETKAKMARARKLWWEGKKCL